MGRKRARMLRKFSQRIGKLAPIWIGSAVGLCFALVCFLSFQSEINGIADQSAALPVRALWRVFDREYDHRTVIRTPRNPPSQVVIVKIDEPTLAALGQFPFDRSVYAKLIDQLEKANAKVLAFDMVFAEPRNALVQSALAGLGEELKRSNAGPRAVQVVERAREELNTDALFSKKLETTPLKIVLGYSYGQFATQTELAEQGAELALDPDFYALLNRFQKGAVGSAYRVLASGGTDLSSMMLGLDPVKPHLSFLHSRRDQYLGFFNASFVGQDPVIRKAPLVALYGKQGVGALSMMSVLAYHDLSPYDAVIRSSSDPLKPYPEMWIDKLNIRFPLNADGSMYLAFYGVQNSLKSVELIDVLQGKPDALKTLSGSIALLGATGAGLGDLRLTPYGGTFPGTEILGTAVANLLEGRVIERGQSFYQRFLVACLVLAMLAALVSWKLPLWWAVGALITMGVGGEYLSQYWFEQGRFFPVWPLIFEGFAVFVAVLAFRYLSAEREKGYIRQAFSRYVSADVVREILRDHDKLKLGGERKELTVLFADMAGFTKISEKLDAQALSKLLNELFTVLTQVILDERGTLDKYMGDAIMCFWGAPLDQPDHAERACAAALKMQQKLREINSRWRAEYGFSVEMRIGVNTGEMSVGNMGSEQLFNYTVLGDNVNLGSRLEGINNVYGTKIILGENTHSRVAGGRFSFRALDKVAVKGKEKPVMVYELLDDGADASWLAAFEAARTAYDKGDFAAAEVAFRKCREKYPEDRATATFLERIAELKVAPANWDGVWRLTTK